MELIRLVPRTRAKTGRCHRRAFPRFELALLPTRRLPLFHPRSAPELG